MATVKKNRKNKVIVAICIVLVIAIIGGGVFAFAKNNSGESVTLHTIATDDIYETVSLTGEVTSGTSKEYKVSSVATVKEVFVKVGDQVKKGDVLATFNVDNLDAQINTLQASYDESLASYNTAVKNQKTAENNANAIAKEIADLQKTVEQLEAQDSTLLTTTKKAGTTKKTTTSKKTTEINSSATTAKNNTVTKDSTNSAASNNTTTVKNTTANTTVLNNTTAVKNTTTSKNTTQYSTDDDIFLPSWSEFDPSNNNFEDDWSGFFDEITGNFNNVTNINTTVQNGDNETGTTQINSGDLIPDEITGLTIDNDEVSSNINVTNVSETLEGLSQALDTLNQTLAEVTQDVETLTNSMQIISTTIAQMAGKVDSEEIANQLVQNLVDSGIAEDMANQIVASIDIDEIIESVSNTKNAQLTSAEIQLVSLQAQYAIFNAQADKTVLNVQKKAVDATKSALDTLKEQKAEMENGWIATFDGTITEVDIQDGMQTSVISTGIKLENLDTMAVKVSLGEYDLHKVKVGMTASITTAYGKYQGEVTSIAPTATGGSGTNILDSVGSMAGISGLSSLTDSGAGVECVITIPETDEYITAGFDADVEIETGEYLGVTVVPIESIKLEKTGSYVYLYNEEESTVTKTLIETGAVSDSEYEVTSGLKVGDKIISAPSSDYEEDTFKVKVTQK